MHKTRRGFTLIEVIAALGIFMIVILALVASYYSYYNSVKQMAYKAIGQNLAEVMLEDARSLQVDLLDSLVAGGKYPTDAMWETYVHSTSQAGCYEASMTPDADIVDAIHYPLDTNSDPAIYDSGVIDSAYRLEKIETVFGVTDSGVINPDLLANMPNNIIITPVYDSVVSSYNYTILLNKETFPYYKRQVVITDLTPNITQSGGKLYKIEITISWTVGGKIDPDTGDIVGGTPKSITLTGEKSFRQ